MMFMYLPLMSVYRVNMSVFMSAYWMFDYIYLFQLLMLVS